MKQVAQVMKNGKMHFEGETNTRQCTCKACGEKIKAGKGYKLINHGSYDFVHNTKECIDSYYEQMASDTEKKYLHGLTFEIEVVTQKHIANSLRKYGFMVLNKGFFTYIKKLASSRNALKEFKVLDGAKYKARVTVSCDDYDDIKFTVKADSYNELTKAIVYQVREYYGIDLDPTM